MSSTDLLKRRLVWVEERRPVNVCMPSSQCYAVLRGRLTTLCCCSSCCMRCRAFFASQRPQSKPLPITQFHTRSTREKKTPRKLQITSPGNIACLLRTYSVTVIENIWPTCRPIYVAVRVKINKQCYNNDALAYYFRELSVIKRVPYLIYRRAG